MIRFQSTSQISLGSKISKGVTYSSLKKHLGKHQKHLEVKQQERFHKQRFEREMKRVRTGPRLNKI